MAEGMGMGDNTKASIITRGLAETMRGSACALGGRTRRPSGFAGVGDLIATCMSPLSRNRTFGENLGQGDVGRRGHRGHEARLPKASSRVTRCSTWPGTPASTMPIAEQVTR
jgi:glycerol-3-phosphate dehydrogenase